MRLSCAFVLLVATLAAQPTSAADLPWKRAPSVVVVPEVVRPLGACLIGRQLDFYRAPGESVEGTLPAGLEVIVIDAPYSATVDLWVRIASPRPGVYYGWVETRDLVCL